MIERVGELRDGRLSGWPTGGVLAVQVGELPVYVGVRTQLHSAQEPAAVDFQGRRRGGRQVVVADARRRRLCRFSAARQPAAASPTALRARPVRGQRLPAQGAI